MSRLRISFTWEEDAIQSYDEMMEILMRQLGADDIEDIAITDESPRSYGDGGPKKKKNMNDHGDSFPGEE